MLLQQRDLRLHTNTSLHAVSRSFLTEDEVFIV